MNHVIVMHKDDNEDTNKLFTIAKKLHSDKFKNCNFSEKNSYGQLNNDENYLYQNIAKIIRTFHYEIKSDLVIISYRTQITLAVLLLPTDSPRSTPGKPTEPGNPAIVWLWNSRKIDSDAVRWENYWNIRRNYQYFLRYPSISCTI